MKKLLALIIGLALLATIGMTQNRYYSLGGNQSQLYYEDLIYNRLEKLEHALGVSDSSNASSQIVALRKEIERLNDQIWLLKGRMDLMEMKMLGGHAISDSTDNPNRRFLWRMKDNRRSK